MAWLGCKLTFSTNVPLHEAQCGSGIWDNKTRSEYSNELKRNLGQRQTMRGRISA